METRKDCAIIIKMDKTPDGEDCIAIGLVFTRKENDRSEPSEAEGFGQIAHRAIIQLYDQLTAPPPAPGGAGLTDAAGTPLGNTQHMGGNRFGAPDPRQSFKPPAIHPGEERDIAELDARKKQ
jgi:hypothetical protein